MSRSKNDKEPVNKTHAPASDAETTSASHFIRNIIIEDIKSDKYGGRVITRFPPEPNGCLHIGHAKAMFLDFGMAEEFEGSCHLRFDDTNPSKEEVEYVEAIKEDIRWLGLNWGDKEYYASDYFEQLYKYALQLIKTGQAYVCSLSAEQIREYRGTLTEPGQESPFRNRSIEENFDLFQKMRAGEFDEGAHVLRAKIDMASPNLNLRDPVMYRVIKAAHHRTGNTWCIYPMYDWAHGQSDSIEGITHSLCSLEFEDHRPLYDWYIKALGIHHPQQIEFARLNITYTVMSKRKLLELVKGGYVSGWNDPRMPTLSGLRRRGYPHEVIRNFMERIGVAKRDSMVDIALLEHCLRENLEKRARRVLGVLRPLRVVITNYPEDQVEQLEAPNHPQNPEMGTRKVPFSRVIYIEQDDFREEPPRKFWRLSPGREVRLRYAYYVTCTDVVKNDKTGEIIEVHCSYDPETRGGSSPDGRKVKSTIHWVSERDSIKAEVRLYDRLFTKPNPMSLEEGQDFKDTINPNSLEILDNCRLEPSLASAEAGSILQFERLGYFCVDSVDSCSDRPVFNRTVPLRDTWAKIQKSMKKGNIPG